MTTMKVVKMSFKSEFYTCQLFLIYRCGTFILRVPAFFVGVRLYLKMSKDVQLFQRVLSNMNT